MNYSYVKKYLSNLNLIEDWIYSDFIWNGLIPVSPLPLNYKKLWLRK